MPLILIADDEKNIREGLSRALKPAGYKIILAEDGEDAYKKFLVNKVDLVIADIKMPKLSGLDLLTKIEQTEEPCPVIILTGHGSVETAVEAMRLGAFDFLTKPVHLDKLELLVQRAINTKLLENTNRALVVKVKEFEVEKLLLGRSKVMKDLIERVKKVAPSKANIYIYGESGTGKELLCDAIHHVSGEHRPLVKVNCSALAPTLLESELFGHEKGSFTGAENRKIGRFEAANGGTIFLDEISETSKEIQVKLLRVIQEKKIERVGSSETIPVDIRIISASNKELSAEVKAGHFREDLFYRLNVIDMNLPPLRQRRGDIEILARHFFQKYCAENQLPEPEITSSVMSAFENYDWPGNIRELSNVIEKCVVLGGDKITLGDLPEKFRGHVIQEGKIQIPYGMKMDEAEKLIIEETIKYCGGNKSEAAKLLGLGRKTIHRKLSHPEDDLETELDSDET